MQVGDLWRTYCRKIETDPIKAKAVTSFLGFMIGDSIAQKIEGHTFNPVRWEARPRLGQCLKTGCLYSSAMRYQFNVASICHALITFCTRRRPEARLTGMTMHAGPCV